MNRLSYNDYRVAFRLSFKRSSRATKAKKSAKKCASRSGFKNCFAKQFLIYYEDLVEKSTIWWKTSNENNVLRYPHAKAQSCKRNWNEVENSHWELSRVLPHPWVFISGFQNTGKSFSQVSINNVGLFKKFISFFWQILIAYVNLSTRKRVQRYKFIWILFSSRLAKHNT